MTVDDLKLIEKLLQSDKLNSWELKTYKEIYDRNPPALSSKQRTMFERAEGKYLLERDYQPIKMATSKCCIEEFKDGWRLVDNAGNVYGPGLSKNDASMIMRWFSDVLGGNVQNPNKTTTPPQQQNKTNNNKPSPF